MAKDLVCGMDVDERQPAAKSEYRGKTYYFCSEYCRRAFDQDPEKYLADPGTAGMPGKGAGMKSLEGTGGQAGKAGNRAQRLDLPVRGMHCAGCASHIEKGLRAVAGIEQAAVNYATSRATVVFNPGLVKPEAFVKSIRDIGYDVGTVTVEIPIDGIV